MEWTEIQPEKALAICEFLQDHRRICDAHTVDFFTENHWECIISGVWRDYLLALDTTHDGLSSNVFLNPETMQQCHLKDFLCEAKQLKFPLSGVCDMGGRNGGMSTPSPIDSFGMTEKKAHEVKRLAAQVKSIANQLDLQQIIDIGSGKGYLSEYLSFVHGLKVYGIDSSAINREGAMDRSRKVHKYFWKQSLEVNRQSETPSTNGHKIAGSTQTSSVAVTAVGGSDDKESEDISGVVTDATVRCIKDEEINEEEDLSGGSCHGKNSPMKDIRESSGSDFNGFFKPITHYIEQSDNVLALIHAEDDCGCHGDCHSDHRSLQPSILIGLHTCGDLACVGLRQFVSNEMLRAVCLVGCCYHHITETGKSPGFPMSELLKSKGFSLGRRALMLACQSEGRFPSVTSGSALTSVFYRAVLQVIFRDEMRIFKSKEDELSLCVGRIKKYSSFVEYCRKAMSRLDIPMDSQPSDEVLEKFHKRYLPSMVKVQRYLQIRVAIAPVIESLIILDRFIYLKEQKEGMDGPTVFSLNVSKMCRTMCIQVTK